MKAVVLLFFCTLFASVAETRAEFFTAQVHMEELLQTEGEIVNSLRTYVEMEEQRLQKVKQLHADYVKLHSSASRDPRSFLANPVNAFLLVKRLTADWNSAKSLIVEDTSRSLIENVTQQRLFPGQEDLSGAATALMRLQDTYQLEASALAKGRIQGARSTVELTAGDCHELGQQAFFSAEYNHTFLWMEEAFRRLEREDSKTADRSDILEYLAYSAYMLGYFTRALWFTKDVLAMNSSHERALENKKIYEEMLQDQGDHGIEEDSNAEGDSEDDSTPNHIDYRHSHQFSDYRRLCRGEKLKTDAEEKTLHCRYFSNGSPQLLLQPLKLEILNADPEIHFYHDVMSDREIDIIKNLSRPQLQRAMVHDPNNPQENQVAVYRISKTTWLEDEDHETVERISRRVEAATGLDMRTSENLQVANYGLGGHYEPHHDFARVRNGEAFEDLGTGNRIATWLNYMSDVDAGGFTAFPIIKVYVKPIKGSAIFWHNLHLNGGGDERTLHAACPVLAGSKWISTKWIHTKGQEFRRKCSLNENK